MVKYNDAHCHYTDFAAPITGVVYNCARESDWAHAIAAATRPGVFAAIGVHPWYATDVSPEWDARMATCLHENPDLMVGEIGLDRAHGDIAAQMPIFARQMELAAEYNRTVHIHCVHAWDVMLNYFANNKLPPAIVVHGFRGGADVARAAMRHGNVYFSFRDAAAPRVRDAIAALPNDRILCESDSDDAATATVILPRIVAQIGEIKNIAAPAMAEVLYNNTMQVIKHG